MGNKLVHPDIECPICLESNKNMIRLNCSHSFDTYCIQKHLITDYHNDNHPRCPYCRCSLYNELRKIFKKWNIIDYSINDIYVKNALDLKMIYNRIKITDLQYNNINKGKIIIPLYNNTYIPIFFIQENININHYSKSNINIIKNNFETMDFSNGCILDCFFHGNHYKKYLHDTIIKNKKVNKLFMKNYNESIMDIYTISDIYISFYVRDINNILCITDDNISNSLQIRDQKCSILYRTYFLIYEKKFHIINEAYRINYI